MTTFAAGDAGVSWTDKLYGNAPLQTLVLQELLKLEEVPSMDPFPKPFGLSAFVPPDSCEIFQDENSSFRKSVCNFLGYPVVQVRSETVLLGRKASKVPLADFGP